MGIDDIRVIPRCEDKNKMNDSIYQRIDTNPRFKELVAKRERFAWLLSLIMLGLYVAFILLIAFEPQVLGTKVSPDSSVTWGIPLGVGLILSAFVLTGIYVRRANGEFDRLNQEVLKEVQQ
ncbi:Inner membrane protein YjcH [Pseudomonas citronellolis]|nr:Inner membrane protein YjcH [Pseudomonas citronellolis]